MPKESPKTQAKPELAQEQIDQLSFREKMGYFASRKEYGAMALAAIIGLIDLKTGKKEKPETKENLAQLHEEVEGEVKEEREELITLREEVKIVKEAKAAGEVLNSELDVPDGRKILVIGDSICHGFQLKHESDMRPAFIGHDGYASYKSLDLLEKVAENEPGKFKGKEKAIIYTGGNNVKEGKPQQIVSDTIKMAKICESKGIPEIVVCTRFPMDPRRKADIIKEKGQDRLDRRLSEGEQLRDSILLAYSRGEFPDGTKLVDLTTQFQDENGTLSEQYAEGAKAHPYRAYKPALNFMHSAESGLTKEEAKRRAIQSPEHMELDDVVVIGSSTGSRMSVAGGLNMSQGMLTSRQIYALVEKRQDQLTGMKRAVLQMGGNDIAKDSPDGYQNVIEYTNKIIAICKSKGIEEVVIITGIPFDSRFDSKRVKNVMILRETLAEAYGSEANVAGVRVKFRDTHEMFGDSEGFLEEEYCRKGKGDFLHARDAVLQQALIDIVASVS